LKREIVNEKANISVRVPLEANSERQEFEHKVVNFEGERNTSKKR
jgi:hypothetical protein